MPVLTRPFFDRHHLTVARDLIGCRLDWNGQGGVIVEVEAYGAEGDPACHTSTRPSARTFFADNPPGTAYVYLNYGVHWLLNVLAADGIILFRALQPTHGIETMSERRSTRIHRSLCSGPGKLGQALALSRTDHEVSLVSKTRRVFARAAGSSPDVMTDVRVGISSATDRLWRFLLSDSPWVSKRAGAMARAHPSG